MNPNGGFIGQLLQVCFVETKTAILFLFDSFFLLYSGGREFMLRYNIYFWNKIEIDKKMLTFFCLLASNAIVSNDLAFAR